MSTESGPSTGRHIHAVPASFDHLGGTWKVIVRLCRQAFSDDVTDVLLVLSLDFFWRAQAAERFVLHFDRELHCSHLPEANVIQGAAA
ncbi:MAG: hypothetical protein ACR2RE_24515 [Geminicoccaceae bacterium]